MGAVLAAGEQQSQAPRSLPHGERLDPLDGEDRELGVPPRVALNGMQECGLVAKNTFLT